MTTNKLYKDSPMLVLRSKKYSIMMTLSCQSSITAFHFDWRIFSGNNAANLSSSHEWVGHGGRIFSFMAEIKVLKICQIKVTWPPASLRL